MYPKYYVSKNMWYIGQVINNKMEQVFKIPAEDLSDKGILMIRFDGQYYTYIFNGSKYKEMKKSLYGIPDYLIDLFKEI